MRLTTVRENNMQQQATNDTQMLYVVGYDKRYVRILNDILINVVEKVHFLVKNFQ